VTPLPAAASPPVTRLGRNIMAMGLSRVSVIALDGLTYILLARYLGPLAYGQYISIAAFIALVDVWADMMTLDVTVREMSRDPEHGHQWLTAATLLRLALAVLGLAAFAVYARLGPLRGQPGVSDLLLIAAALLPMGALRMPLAAFRAHMRIRYELAVLAAARSANLVLIAWVLYRGGGLAQLFLAMLASRVLLAILCWTAMVRVFRFVPATSVARLRQITRRSLPMGVSGLFVAIQLKADIMLVAAIAGAETAGLYSAVAQLPEYLLYVPVIFTTPVLPVLSRHAAGRDLASFQRLYQSMFDTVMAIVLPIAVVSSLLPTEVVVWLFGPGFTAAGAVLPTLMMTVVFMWFSHATAIATVAAGLQDHFIWIQAICVTLYVSAIALLIPLWSMHGAATARLMAAIMAPLLTCMILRRRFGVSLSTRTLRPACAAAVVMAVAVVAASRLPLHVAALVGLTMYGAGLWAVGCNPLALAVEKEIRT
jgi:O-antigen/teichoic acid export membrane protein